MAANWTRFSFFLVLVMTVSILTPLAVSSGDGVSDHKIRTLLKRLNKPAIKSIQSRDGAVIDCVPINKQPALDPDLFKRSEKITVGASISPSNYGETQQYIPLLIWKDLDSGNWWLQYGDELIGYWPAKLLSHLQYHYASAISWGGEVVNLKFQEGQHTTTQMGSGHFVEAGWQKGSHFKNIQVVDGFNQWRNPGNLQAFTDHEKCYNLQSGYDDVWGSYFYFGGPGRNHPNCP